MKEKRCRFDPSLSGSLDLGKSLALLEAALLLQPHNLEALEVGKGLAAHLLRALLGPVALPPLLIDTSLLPSGLDGTGAGTTGQLVDHESGQEEVGEGERLTGNGEAGV